MKINKNNYHYWISDYYDGSLSDSDYAMLKRFLDLNPELKNEFESFGEMILHPDISIRIDKEALRKSLDKENTEVIEHFALALSENDLDPDQEKKFAELQEKAEIASAEARIFSSLRLIPDNTSYPDKSGLKRIPYRLGIGRNIIRVLAVAASLTLIISLSILLPRQTGTTFTYNTAYLLPFNRSEATGEFENTGRVLINAGRLEPREIKIKEEAGETGALLAEETARPEIYLEKSPFPTELSLSLVTTDPGKLLAMQASKASTIDLPEKDLSPRQFIAMNFRRHLLKEDIDNRDKLKVYEVADAGIDGLNKLLGWEMEFEKEKTEDGRLASFRFTSQLLNLDHKTKKVVD